MMKRESDITPAELEILRYLQKHQPATVRDVADHFAEVDGRARTTVLTLMERLRQKGHVSRRRVSGVNQYETRTPEAQVTEGLVRSFVQQILGGTVAPLLHFLGTEARHLSEEEVAELKRIAGELEEPPTGKGKDTLL
jgi:predicted transcriptional regulator